MIRPSNNNNNHNNRLTITKRTSNRGKKSLVSGQILQQSNANTAQAASRATDLGDLNNNAAAAFSCSNLNDDHYTSSSNNDCNLQEQINKAASNLNNRIVGRTKTVGVVTATDDGDVEY